MRNAFRIFLASFSRIQVTTYYILRFRTFPNCFPGRGVTNPAFTGSVAELDAEFVTHVKQLVEILLKGLVPKQEAGKTLRCRDLIHYFKAFASILNRSPAHVDSCAQYVLNNLL